MGDSLSWAADQAADARRNTPAYKENVLRCIAYNKLMEQVPEIVVAGLTVRELGFLLELKQRVNPWYDYVTEEQLSNLADIVDKHGS